MSYRHKIRAKTYRIVLFRFPVWQKTLDGLDLSRDMIQQSDVVSIDNSLDI